MEIVGRQQKKLGRALLSTMSSSYKSISGMCRYLLTPILNFHDDFKPHLTCRSKARRELSQGNLNKKLWYFYFQKNDFIIEYSLSWKQEYYILYQSKMSIRNIFRRHSKQDHNKDGLEKIVSKLCVSLRKKQKTSKGFEQ